MVKDITINLDESINAKDYDLSKEDRDTSSTGKRKGTLIHQTEFTKTLEFIGNNVPYTDADSEKENCHNTITILGTRGSGKTSFLLSVKRALKKHQLFPGDKNKDKTPADIVVLPIIDPTLIEAKAHVFLNVISLISDLVEKTLDQQECNSVQNESLVFKRKEWRQSLNSLAAGLPSIDGIGNNHIDSWQDPEFVMDNGLRAVAASQKLSKNFNEFLKISLNILGKRAFLLMFDDIDVDASKGWAVLETIRKYFTGGRLISLISGDLELYSTVVRQKKWVNFGKEILEYEGEYLKKMPVFNDIITKLESQYLQKILQPKYRVHLYTIGECKRYNSESNIYVYETAQHETDEHLKSNEIKNLYIQILKYFGVVNKYQAEAYYTYLLGLPLRTQIQFLSLFQLKSGHYMAEDAGPMSLTDVFLSDLNASAVDANIAVNNPKSLNRIILKFLLKEKKLEELYQLQPITTNYSLNASLLSLNFLLSYSIQNDPYLIFDYFTKVGYIRNLLPLIGYRKSSESVLTPSIEDLCDNSLVINDNILKDIMGKTIAYLRGTIDKEGTNTDKISKGGTIPLYGEADTAKGDNKSMSGRIDRVLKGRATFIEHMLVYIPLSSNQYIRKQSSLLTYSVYLLLGAIGELIRKVNLDDVKNGFSELSQLRAYMIPDFTVGSRETTVEANVEPQERPERKQTDIKIEQHFENWVRKYSKQKISPHLLGKISTRFFFALTAIENSAGDKKLGEVFHAHIVALMNAILIEDCRENTTIASSLTLSNTNFSNRNFIENLQAIIDKMNELDVQSSDGKSGNQTHLKDFENQISFSRWLLSCPLFLAYLRPDTTLKTKLIKVCNLPDNYEIFDLKISEFLDEISVKNKSGLSLNRPTDYPKIRQRFKEMHFDESQLKKSPWTQLMTELRKIGISGVTARSVAKYNNSKYDTQ